MSTWSDVQHISMDKLTPDEFLSVFVPCSSIVVALTYLKLSLSHKKDTLCLVMAAASAAILADRSWVLESLKQRSYLAKSLASCYIALEMLFWLLDLYRQKVYLETNEGDLEASRKRFPKAMRKKYLEEITQFELKDKNRGQGWIAGWFFDSKYSDLREGNLRQIVTWAWFDLDVKIDQGVLSQLTKEELGEIDHAVNLIQEKLGKLEPGFNDELKCMRQSLDPIEFGWHRPLLVYFFLDLVPYLVSRIAMYSLGFSKKKSGKVSYWHKKSQSDSTSAPPTVFLHGIGIGVLPYVKLLSKLSSAGKELIVPEQPHVAISFRYYISTILKRPPLNYTEFMESLTSMLKEHNSDGAEFIGHSYGTIPIAWMVKMKPSLVKRVVLLDPITLFMHQPGICKSFLYEKRMDQGLARDFLSYLFNKDPGIVHTLMRNFYWSTNTLWLSELLELQNQHTIVLSELDEYVPSSDIKRYVDELNDKARKDGKDHPIELYWCKDLGHGEFLACAKNFQNIYDLIVDYEHNTLQ